jgi:hypothetical protein
MGTKQLDFQEPIDLSRFDEEYAKTTPSGPAKEPSAYEVPDGAYSTTVEDAFLTKTRNTGNPMLVWRLRITSGAETGRTLTKTRVITEKTLPFLREDLNRIGVDVGRLSELNGRLREMLDREVPVFKKTKDGWPEVSFCRRSPASGDGKPAPEVDDDLPF